MLNKKTNTDRRFPGESGPRPDLAKVKRQEAKERQSEYDKLTTAEKLARLPAGRCEKQRKKLSSTDDKDLTSFKEVIIDNSRQKLKAKDRRAMEKEKNDVLEED